MRISTLLKSLLLMCLIQASWAQNTRRYDSLYTTETNLVGHATFRYTLNKNQIVKEGPFFFTHEHKDSLNPTIIHTNTWIGNYKQDQKVGAWSYQTTHKRAEIKKITQSGLDYTLFATDEMLKVGYKDGFLDGPMEFTITLFKDGKKDRILESYKTTFKDHKVDGSFDYQISDMEGLVATIKGNAKAGFMIGQWSFEHHKDSLLEVRDYKEGVLLNLIQIRKGDTVKSLDFPLSGGLEKRLNNDPEGIDIEDHPLSLIFSDGYPKNSAYSRIQKPEAEYLQRVMDEAFQYDLDIEFDYGLPLGTARGIYPITPEEEETLEDWRGYQDAYERKVSEFKDLDIDRLEFLQDTILQAINQWVEKQGPILDHLHEWDPLVHSDELIYYYREGMAVDYVKVLMEYDNIFVRGRNKVLHYKVSEEKSQNFITYVIENIKERTRLADSLENVALVELQVIKYAQQVFELNQSILKEYDRVDSVYGQFGTGDELKQAIRHSKDYYFSSYYQQQYDHFISEEDRDIQLQLGKQLLKELEVLEDIYVLGNGIEERAIILDTLYTEYLFDPFTMSDRVPNRAKKRLYEPVVHEMMPFLIRKAGDAYKDPFEVLFYMKEVYELQSQLLKLRAMNTQKLEKKLKSTKSTENKIELLKEV